MRRLWRNLDLDLDSGFGFSFSLDSLAAYPKLYPSCFSHRQASENLSSRLALPFCFCLYFNSHFCNERSDISYLASLSHQLSLTTNFNHHF